MTEPLTLYVHPCFRIDWHGAADAAFIGLGPEDWQRRALQAEAEVAILQGLVDSLADRVAVQSELLSRRAEGS